MMNERRQKTVWVALLAVLVSLAVTLGGGLIRAADDVLILVRASVSSTGAQANLNSDEPVLSNLGRYTAFHTFATNLVPHDGNLFRDVYVHDRVTGTTEKVSVSSEGKPGFGGSAEASISYDGRYVAFESWAPNLVSHDWNWTWDVFVHDRETGITERVSVSDEGKQGWRPSQSPSISGDGRYVAFESDADNLVPQDRHGDEDVFVYDRETKTIRLVSVASDGTQGDDDSSDPSISADGRYVVFESEASNLVPGDTNGLQDIFLHDLMTGETRRVSVSSTGQQPNRSSRAPSVSGNGQCIVFESAAANLVPDDTNDRTDVFVHEWVTGQTTRVTVSSEGAQGNRGGEDSAISADGRYLVFESKSSNLVPDDTNDDTDVFVHDRQTGETRRVSLDPLGGQAHRESDEPDISPDGAFVAFEADSPLVPGDTNRREDIYVRETGLIVNAPPVAEDDETITPQDTEVDIDVLANDSDPNGDPFFIYEFTQPANGAASLNEDGTFHYVPNTGFNGPDSFTYTLDDTRGGTDTATVRVTVEPATPPGPQAEDDEASTVAETPVDIDVLTNDAGAGLSVTEVTDPSHGTAVINPDSTVTYTPDAGFVGEDTFEYTAADNNGLTDVASVTVTVEPPPLAAVDDHATTIAETAVDVDVLTNDTGSNLTITEVTNPGHGEAEILSGTAIRYTPVPGYVGPDSFDYTVADESGASASATVHMQVDAAPLVARDDEASTITGDPVIIAVLQNDSGTGIAATDVSDPSNGTAVMNGDNTITYTSVAGFTGQDSFTYTITDLAGSMATATVRVTVDAPPNTPPEALDDDATTFETVPVVVDVLTNDSDPDNDPLSIESITQPGNGAAAISGPGSLTYTPDPGFHAMDSFTYTIADGRGGMASATVHVDVLPDDVAPQITANVAPLPNAAGWNASDVTVAFDCLDGESGIESCSDAVVIAAEGAGQQITGTAVDRAGNSTTTTVVVNLDKTPPSIVLSGPMTARRGQSVSVNADAADVLGLNSIRFLVDGVEVRVDDEPPFDLNVNIPGSAATGSNVHVEAIASDLAGNTASADPLVLQVLGGGYILGEAYDDSKGLPLAGVTVSLDGPSVLSDPLGRFGIFTELPTAPVRFERNGFTPVERMATVDSLAGTLMRDARLTPLAPATTTIDSGGGTATNGLFELVVPPGALSSATDLRLTEVSPQGLRASLPLGWSPAGSVQIDPEGTAFSIPADLQLSRSALSGVSVDLVRYESSLHTWVVEAVGLTGDDAVSAAISSTGTYAFVVADSGSTAPPLAEVGQALLGSTPVDVSFGISASSEVTPEAAPVGPDARAIGSVVLFSPLIQPSGTVVSARVEETFESFDEGTLRPEPFTQELTLYRFPPRPDGELHATFPVTPSRSFTVEELREGVVHVDIQTSPALLRGTLVGGEGQVILGEGDAAFDVPPGALSDTTSAFVEALDIAEVALAPTGLALVGAAEVDLAGNTLALGAMLSVPAPDGLTGQDLFAARFVVVNGLRKLKLVGPASLSNDRLSVGGIFSGGTYFFFQSDEPLALVRGMVSESAQPARLAVVESSTSAFMDITADDGLYQVAAALRETTLTARSLVSGNRGADSVTPMTTDPVFIDLSLTTTGPFVTAVQPVDGARGVAFAPVITLSFSEPVVPASVTLASLFFRKSDGTPVDGRVVLGSGNRSASFLPSSNLEPSTGYELVATDAITDTNGNGLLPFTSTFTTVDLAPPPFDPDAVTVTFPDANGQVTVSAEPGSFESAASIFIINFTTGVVVSGVVSPDGGFSFEIQAAITDELEIRVLDSGGREVVIEKTEYQAADGSVAIGRKGGKVATGDFVLEVPEGALPNAAVLKLNPIAQDRIDALPVPEGTGAIGSGVELETGGTSLQKEADLSFPIPPGAPPNADYLIVRKIEEGDLTLYETIDSASVVDDQVVTNSFPFSGVLVPGTYLAIWAQKNLGTGLSPLGVITGIAQETDANPIDPQTVPLPGVVVRADKSLGLGDYTATTGPDGRFTLWDINFGSSGGTVNLVAKDPMGREVRAIAFESPGVRDRFPNLGRYNKAGEVLFNFALSPPPPPPPQVTVRLFRKDADGKEVEITNGFAATGQELLIRVAFTQPPSLATAEVNDIPVSLEKVDGFNFLARFTPPDARGYTFMGTARDAFLREISFNKSFLGVAAGGGNTEPLPGPPSVISDAAVPRAGEKGVPVSQIFQALFTEPVTNVSSSSVFLREVGGGMVPLELIGTDPDGNVGPVTAATEVVALTLRPLQGLKFSSSYELVFGGEIVDTDSERLTPDPTVVDFSTFTPEKLGEAQASQAAGVVVVGNRAFVAQNTYPGKLRVFDLSDPTQPQPSDETNFFYGLFRRIVALEGVDLGLGPTDVVAVLSVNPLSGQGILTVYDVAGEPPFPWIAVVTTTQPPMTSMGLALMGSSGYVAAGEEGVKIFDVNRAADLYRNTKKPGESDPGFAIGRSVNTKGQGFAQEAFLDAVTLTAPGGTLHATSLAVGNTVLGRAAFVGSYLPSDSAGYFSSVNVSGSGQNEELATLRLEKDSLMMGTPARIGLTSVGDQELAVAVGGFGSPKRGRLAVIDITQPAAPVILSITELRVSSGNSLEFDPNGTTLFVGTSEGLEVYDLTNPASPTWAGSLAGAGEEVAVASQIVVTAGGDVGLNVHLLAAAIDDFTDDLQQPSLTGTVQAPDPNDHVFVTSIPTNNECQFRTSGPIVFNIEIGRYVGEVEEDGTLVHAARLIANGFLSRNATLTIAGYDVDSGVPRNPEIDRVLVNGEEVGTLRGRKNEWTKSSFQVPMEFLRFPGRPQPGASLTPQTNEVRVEIDVGSVPNEARWCTAIDWGSLAFKTVSPIILIHGNGSDGDFFKRQGFTEYLEAVRFPFDNSINLVPKENFVHINAEKLNERIPVIVKSFGVDSVHLVVHSKGGLDSRDYLARFQPDHDDEFKVLSFTSLSTPHNGSIGADVLLLNERASFEAARSEFVDFPTFTDLATAFIGVANGKRNLTTTFAAHFNTRNVPLLPQDIVFNVVAADADINGSTKVDTLEEIRGMTLEDQKLADVLAFSPAAAVFLVDRAYQLLRGTQSIQYVLGSGQIFQGTPNERTERTIPIAKLTSIQPPRPLGNDALVTIPSGFGEGSLEPRVTKRLELRGEDLKGVGEGGRNHASVADLPVASKVLPWIVEVEEARGDLK